MKVALVDVLGAFARDRRPGATVPQHHRAAAILALGDRALKFSVGHWVVFGPHREPLVLWVEAWPTGHRPRFQHAVDLDPEVPVEPRGVVLLNDELIAGLAGLLLARRFGGQLEIALGVIGGEGI